MEITNKHQDTIDVLGSGKLEESAIEVVRQVAAEVAKNHA